MQTFNINIPGFTIACKTTRYKDRPPLLVLHGWLDNANSFDALAHLLENDFYVIAIDLPGHGLSSHLPEGSHYHFIDALFSIEHILHALHIETFHLLGHSMGACLASLLAGIMPHHIKSLTLIEGLGPFSSPDNTCREQLMSYLQRKAHQKKPRPYPSFTAAAQARAKNGKLALPYAEILCKRGVEERDGAFYWRHDRRLLIHSPLQLTEKQILSCLSGIQSLTCLILANNGYMFNEPQLEERIRTVPHLKTYKVDGSHHVHMENPQVIEECMRHCFNL